PHHNDLTVSRSPNAKITRKERVAQWRPHDPPTPSPDHWADFNMDGFMTLVMPMLALESSPSPRKIGRAAVDLHLRKLLDRANRQLRLLDLTSMNACVDALDYLRRDVGPAEWTRLIADVIAPHPVVAQLLEEPFTRRAFEKPRGYAGDAVMLDLAY